MIRAVAFDLDGTLIDRAGAHGRWCRAFMAEHPAAFPPDRSAADLAALAAGADDPDWCRRAFARRVVAGFPALGLAAAEVARAHSARLATFVEPDPAVVGMIRAWAGRYRLAIVTNGAGPGQRAKLARLGLGAEAPRAFISGELGVRKPDPRLFGLALRHLGVAPAEALFVGDDPARDVAGAAGAGMRTCWVSGGRSYPADLPRPDRVVARAADLAGGLDA